jgi:protein-S-isoprenylcysteine O-methyltransferase Ste14
MSASQETESVSPLVAAWTRISRHLSQDFLGGPRVLKFAWVINVLKGATVFFIAALMLAYRNFSTAAWVYLALHGTYGLCWLLKHLAFPDPLWERRITFGGAFMSVALVLGPYWLFPFLLVSDVLGPRPGPSLPLIALCIGLHTLGVAIMLSADCQKYFTLRVRRGLIDDGMFRYTRNPNYLGEMMIYGSYALLVGHWIPWAVLAWVWIGIFLPNMLNKDASLSRYPGWAAYKARSGLLLPWILPAAASHGPDSVAGGRAT